MSDEQHGPYPCIEVYPRVDGRFAWRLVAQNGNIIATDGGQGYENEVDAEDIANKIIRTGNYAEVDMRRTKN